MSDALPERPEALEFNPDAVPEELRQREQWVCWRFKYNPDREEYTKIPIDASSGKFASSTDSDTWSTFEDAVAYHEREDTDTAGCGFVVHSGDMFVGFDLDDCRDPASGDLEPWAAEIVEEIDSYQEVSPSGTGLRGFGLGTLPDDGTNRTDIEGATGHLELYDSGRYLTVTGTPVESSTADIREVNDAVEEVYREYVHSDDSSTQTAVDTRTNGETPTPEAGKTALSDLSDSEIIDIATNAENGDYFSDLLEGRWQQHTSRWQESSHSEARQAFAYLLAFYTGGDERRMLNIFKNSDLCRGDDDLRTFEEYEAPNAVAAVGEYYDPEAGGDPQPPVPDNPKSDARDDSSTRRDILTPADVKAAAGLGEDGEISDLDDRQKAASVWQLVEDSDNVHVCVRRESGSLWAYDDGIWKPEGERALRHAAARALGTMNYGDNVLRQLKAQVRADPFAEVEADTFGLEPGYMAVENGLLDLSAAAAGDADAIRDLKPEDYALTRLPVKYDPEATGDRWRQFVGEVVEPSKIDAVQEYIGYTLHRGEMPHNKAMLFVGSGKNGKSTFLNVIRELLGEEQTTTKPVHSFENDFDVADLRGSVANIDADLSEGSLSSRGIATFKRLTGGDSVSAQRKYKDPFSFKPTTKHLYACNQVPDVSKYVSDHDIAFWRRWIVVEFPNYFTEEERDPELGNELTTDSMLSAVLNWAIEGWDRLQENGTFTDIEGHDETRRRWQSWGESVEKFIAECVERDPSADRLSTGEAFERYQAWCREVGTDTVGRRRFTDTLKKEDVGYGRHRINGRSVRGYDALGLSEDVPTPDAGDRGGDDSDDDGGGDPDSSTRNSGLGSFGSESGDDDENDAVEEGAADSSGDNPNGERQQTGTPQAESDAGDLDDGGGIA